ncbi:phosphatase PAP2 family protein [Rhabdothermincola salaria]|uniref:phosphatase PAP2 family protein n=1 Tax=Rhabdothermincola salaria TaxID=2903142 RepID=UPI001E57883A|nr:phosphatase PAP2 family protein [Rhabdothermincola salaria]MCD9624773.1 phosphatase PAP2 family protein [Rhabdothermincola salaria]
MTDLAAPARSVPSDPRGRAARRLSDGSSLAWWRELLLVGVLYLVYETARNLSTSTPERAFDNARRVIDWQRAVNLWHELPAQEWALQYTPMIVAANYFYGSAYIVVTVLGLVFLYRMYPDDYPLWRNTLAIGTLLGLVGFATFPLMPPRLLDEFAGGQPFGFVDTLISYPTFWSFDSAALQAVSNQYAAMPSLHCGWAFWAMWVFWPRVRTWWGKALAVAYPAATIYVVVITANHYLLDAAGGLVVFAVAYAIARGVTRAGRRPAVPAPEPVGP